MSGQRCHCKGLSEAPLDVIYMVRRSRLISSTHSGIRQCARQHKSVKRPCSGRRRPPKILCGSSATTNTVTPWNRHCIRSIIVLPTEILCSPPPTDCTFALFQRQGGAGLSSIGRNTRCCKTGRTTIHQCDTLCSALRRKCGFGSLRRVPFHWA